MIALYIGSTKSYSGKSLVGLGLALKMQSDGFSVGYMKPFGRVPTLEDGILTDGDVLFMRKTLHLKDRLEDLCPVVYSQDLMAETLRGRTGQHKKKVLKAFSAVSKDKDVVLIGGGRDMDDGRMLGISGVTLAGELDAGVIVVDPFGGEFCTDCLLTLKEELGGRLLGAVINRVPLDGIEHLVALAGPYLKKKGIPLFGVLPTDKILGAVTIRQMTETLGGRVLCCEERLDELVENFSIGAMDVDSAIKYFRRTRNKAVITGGHRSDIQLAALETSTRCLVLTGDMLPNDLIIAKARLSGVPIIAVKQDTLSTVEHLESLLGKARIREGIKTTRAIELMRDHFNFGLLYSKLGLNVKR